MTAPVYTNDCIANGILLRNDLHRQFGTAGIVFLKIRSELDACVSSTLVSNVRRVQTPNFVMVPADVPRIEQGSMPDNRTTLQYMEPPTELYTALQGDVKVDWRDGTHPAQLPA